jgi:hypothetical protein
MNSIKVFIFGNQHPFIIIFLGDDRINEHVFGKSNLLLGEIFTQNNFSSQNRRLLV